MTKGGKSTITKTIGGNCFEATVASLSALSISCFFVLIHCSCAFPRLLRAEVEEQPIKPYFPQRPCMGDAETSDAFVTPDEDKAKGYVDSTYVYFQPVPEEDSGNDLYFFGFVDVWFPDALQLLKADLQLRQGKVSNLQPW
ncbi:Plant specific mitochondrial import receptor subunit TOM20 [Artemisia annua]|uniref:Plant specific mitochondrial import receptor subunit TOM20 n=1 Tax=Artemisia annua TaxID=35608 RepID=A0A2U1N2A5_ARTAN|nr:Plant specific mitochondrial import receptor subunit TOM20 [Artemisia annua]